jgi:hypothetical protein
MASKSFKAARNSFARDLADEDRQRRSKTLGETAIFNPQRYNQGGERQSELLPSPRPPAAAPRPKPKAAAPRATPPLPPRRPPGPGTPPGPGEPPPVIPTPEIPIYPTEPMPGPLVMPQFDPLGVPTGPMAPPAPGSSTQGPEAAALAAPPPLPGGPGGPILPPPMTGPLADRMPPGAPPMAAGGPDAGAALAGAVGPTPGPQGLLDALGGYFKRMVPPLRNPF